MFSDNVKPDDEDSRGPGRPRGRTAQSRETEERLYRTATELFARDGYEATTLRGIAREAGVSPGLLYRYFPSKRAVVMRLYDELSSDFAARAAELPEGRWRDRFGAAMRLVMERLAPHKRTLRGVLGLLVASPEDGVFASDTSFSRERVQGVFEQVAADAKDAPGGAAPALGRVLYLAHLGLLLWWLLDRSPDRRATRGLLALLPQLLAPAAIALRLRRTRRVLRDFDRLLNSALLGGAAQSNAP